MILLDTHVLLWLLRDDPKLGKEIRQVIGGRWPTREIAACSISFWEIGMRLQKGRLELPSELNAWRATLLESGLVELPVDGEIAVRAGLLPDMHGDPADRIIVATALTGHTLATADREILDWPGQLDRLDARL